MAAMSQGEISREQGPQVASAYRAETRRLTFIQRHGSTVAPGSLASRQAEYRSIGTLLTSLFNALSLGTNSLQKLS
jgi:hypothetical protein